MDQLRAVALNFLILPSHKRIFALNRSKKLVDFWNLSFRKIYCISQDNSCSLFIY